MTLAGGDPERMNLRSFLNAGFALLVEAYTGLGVNLVEACERAWEGIGVEKAPEAVEASVEAQNEASFAQLEALMQGVK